MPSPDDYAPSRRELSRMVGRQSVWVMATAGALIWLVVVLGRKGVLSWSDLKVTDG